MNEGIIISDEREAFEHFLDLDPGARRSFMDDLELDRPALALRVRRLVGALEKAESLEPTPPGASRSLELTEVGPYRLIERLGEGGMGVVYLAQQSEPVRRRVAIKLLRPGFDSAEILARFENERRTMALMSHPGIARVLEASTSREGLPYYVMEYVAGKPATEFADAHRLPIRARITLFLDVLDAVRHAHMRGVIHRDLKPSNILVSLEGHQPAVKIIDFGVAKAIGGVGPTALHTRAGVLVGTPHYMSPEQADRRSSDVDVRSDVYSLGMVLYELLVGALPFRRHTDPMLDVAQVVARIMEGDLPSPSTRFGTLDDRERVAASRDVGVGELFHTLRGELDWIVARATDRDVRRRYESVSDFADDLRRHLDGQPVSAGPGSVGYRLRKFVRKHAVGVAVLAAALLSGMAYTWTLQQTNLRINDALGVAQIEADRATAFADILTSLIATPRLEGEQADTGLVRALIPRALAEAQRSRNQPERQGHLLSLLGSVYTTIGEYESAIEVLESARTVQRSVYGAEHLNVAETERLLGENYRRVARFDESRATLERALRVERGALPPDHARIAATLTELHFVYREEGDFETAEALLREGLEMRERMVGDVPDAAVAESINLLAALQRRGGRLEDARSNYQRALEIRRRLHPDGDAGPIAESLNNLGVQAVAEGDLQSADTLFAAAAEIFSRAYGEGHEFVSIARRQRSSALRKLGRHEEVIEVRRAMLVPDSTRMGPYHQRLAESHLFIAVSLRDLGRYEEAVQEYEAAETHIRRKHGDDHPYLGVILHSRARQHIVNGNPAHGMRYVDRAIELYERHGRTTYAIAAYRTRGELNVALGRDEAARDDLEESLRRARQAELDTQVEAAARMLVGVYERLGDRAGADTVRVR